MEFKRENPNCTFQIPDVISVRMQMAYFSLASTQPNADLWERLWKAAQTVITEWTCEIFPDFKADLGNVTDPQITNVVIWAALEVKQKIDALESVPKN